MWSIGVIWFVLREIQMWTQMTKKYFTKNVQIRLIFQTVSLFSLKFDVVCLQPYSWLENFSRYSSFGTMILGSLIVSPVLSLLSSRNTLSVTHSDIALYEVDVNTLMFSDFAPYFEHSYTCSLLSPKSPPTCIFHRPILPPNLFLLSPCSFRTH